MRLQTMITFTLGLSFALFANIAYSQPQDPQVRAKQGELREQQKTIQINNQLIRETARDKRAPMTGPRRTESPTGYDYSQVKGYGITPTSLRERIDKVLQRANALGYLDDAYNPVGATTVPCQTGPGSATIRTIEAYVVEATEFEIENEGVPSYDLIELRVIMDESCPEPREEEGGDEESVDRLRRARRGGQQTKQYILSGRDLWTSIRLTDETLYEDIISQRVNEKALPTPDMRQFARYRGPFIIQEGSDLETATSRFADFWNFRDTLRSAIIPLTDAAAGPLYRGDTPLMLLDGVTAERLTINNPDENPLQISRVEFTGENADQFRVVTKAPIMLDAKQSPQGRSTISFEYVGDSPYEVKSQLSIVAQNTSYSQVVDIIANPGRFPADFVVMDLSLDRLELRSPARSGFAPDWRLGLGFGNPEIGLPRWTSGMATLSVGYKHQMSVGMVLPMNMTASDMPSPVGFNNSYYYSPTGYNIAFDFTFGFPFSLGGNITITDRFEGDDKYSGMKLVNTKIDAKEYKDNFFNISTAALLYYPIMFKDSKDNSSIMVRFNIGGGFTRIERNLAAATDGQLMWYDGSMREVEAGKLYWVERERDIFDVYVRIDFINTGSRNVYGIGLQYFGGRMMADAWLELPEWLRVEANYSFLLRSKEVWEYENSFFMITPRLRIGIPSLFK